MSIWIIVENILLGAVAGGLSASVGFIRQEHIPHFDIKKLIKTLIIGAFIGGVGGTQGYITIDSLEDLGIITVVTAFADRLADLAYRRLRDLYNYTQTDRINNHTD